MKRLLLPLLAALALPFSVYSGNLGVADKILNGVNAKKLESKKNIYEINVGSFTWKATAEFLNGRFIIKTDEKFIKKMKREGRIPSDIEIDQSGITPEQVISYDYHITRRDDGAGSSVWNIVYSLFYLDSEGQHQLASWGIGSFQKNSENMAKNFNDAFLNWLNQK